MERRVSEVEALADMTLSELLGRIALIAAALSFVIQISPIKLNPWSWVARKIGKAINHDINDKVDLLSKKVDKLQAGQDENAAKLAREKILEFGDDLIYQPERRHSKDRFDDVVQHITEYDGYCKEHPEFKNHMTETTTRLILNTYEKCMREHSFL